jgi:hypothetical protein
VHRFIANDQANQIGGVGQFPRLEKYIGSQKPE